jgi:hypothetical protein
MDAAVILVGNSTEKRLELLRKYGVKYVYWHAYWINSEYTTDQSGRIIGWADPLMVKDTPEYRSYFEEYGIQYSPQKTYIDPALRGDYFRKLDLLLIVPAYRGFDAPWSSGLDPYLMKVWEYNESGYPTARIYEVKY